MFQYQDYKISFINILILFIPKNTINVKINLKKKQDVKWPMVVENHFVLFISKQDNNKL